MKELSGRIEREGKGAKGKLREEWKEGKRGRKGRWEGRATGEGRERGERREEGRKGRWEGSEDGKEGRAYLEEQVWPEAACNALIPHLASPAVSRSQHLRFSYCMCIVLIALLLCNTILTV